MHILIDGYREFYRKYFTSGDSLYRQLTEVGQSPRTLIIACSDSRVDPSIVTNARPGDIFVIRNVANLVPPYEVHKPGQHGVSAALEFAVCVLEVKNVIIMGHSHCAGIQTLLHPERVAQTDFIGKWVNIAHSAREKTLKQVSDETENCEQERQHRCEKEGILLSLDNLLTFPWVKSRVEDKSLKLHGWYFSLADGRLSQYHPESGRFEMIEVGQ